MKSKSRESVPFSNSAQALLAQAGHEEARFSTVEFIGTEHLLLALTRQQDSIAARVLARAGVDPAMVQRDVGFIVTRGEGPRFWLGGLTPRASEVIDLATREAALSGSDRVTTGDLLVGMLAEGEGIAAGVLESHGMELDSIRIEVAREVEQRSES